jgi:hypothetical protein
MCYDSSHVALLLSSTQRNEVRHEGACQGAVVLHNRYKNFVSVV